MTEDLTERDVSAGRGDAPVQQYEGTPIDWAIVRSSLLEVAEDDLAFFGRAQVGSPKETADPA